MAYEWTIEKMITAKRAAIVASELFPEEIHSGDCRNYIGAEGLPCPICAAANEQWVNRQAQVRAAMINAFK